MRTRRTMRMMRPTRLPRREMRLARTVERLFWVLSALTTAPQSQSISGMRETMAVASRRKRKDPK